MKPEYIYRYEVYLPKEYHKEYGTRVGIFHVPSDIIADWDRDLSIENRYDTLTLDIALNLYSPNLKKFPAKTGGFMSFFTEEGIRYFETKLNGIKSIVDNCPYGCVWRETTFDTNADEFTYLYPIYEDQYQKIYYAIDIFYAVKERIKMIKDVLRS